MITRKESKHFKMQNIVILITSLFLLVLSTAGQARPPVIIIPGLIGSELVNSKTGEQVWIKVRRSKVDDLRLPLSANLAANRDNLVPGDIIRSAKLGILPRTDVYAGLINALQTKGGYKEGKWNNPPVRGYENTIYVFPYDWRRDNVENARLLVRRIETLKRRLRRPNLKFDVIAHSMGGLIARYAAMYGNADLPLGNSLPKPTWAGSKDLGRIIMLGTPNEGSIIALNSLVDGVSLFGITINLPFVQNLSKFDFFTIPSLYQLLPPSDALKIYDENLKPVAVDIYDPKTWVTYGWSPMLDKKFEKEFSVGDQRRADAYFISVLDRARRFQDALKTASRVNPPVAIDVVGAECRDTADAALVYQDKKSGNWKTIFKPESFTTSDGRKIEGNTLKTILQSPGDAVVSKRSLLALTLSSIAKIESLLVPSSTLLECEDHNKLPSNPKIQDYILNTLSQRQRL